MHLPFIEMLNDYNKTVSYNKTFSLGKLHVTCRKLNNKSYQDYAVIFKNRARRCLNIDAPSCGHTSNVYLDRSRKWWGSVVKILPSTEDIIQLRYVINVRKTSETRLSFIILNTKSPWTMLVLSLLSVFLIGACGNTIEPNFEYGGK